MKADSARFKVRSRSWRSSDPELWELALLDHPSSYGSSSPSPPDAPNITAVWSSGTGAPAWAPR
eukprot:4572524-Pyramimonas_sp.AAC.1